jgi:uncharacterized membrane protein
MGRAFFGFTTAPGLTTVDGAVWQRVATATKSRHFGSANAVHKQRFPKVSSARSVESKGKLGRCIHMGCSGTLQDVMQR